MERAISLAKGGIGFVNPNPLVGAVIVKEGKIIGEGFHEHYGELHAERNALKNCTESAQGAEMYVTLEPCCHYGKNPPCTEAVIASGIKKVYVGSNDPNPLVAGGGIKQLRDAGIEVVENVMKDECDALNDIFFHFITANRPYVIMKAAISADGKIACGNGASRWVTNELSRAHTHELRKRVSSIMVGVNTVIADDPMLNCRCENPSNPVRVICDTNLRTPLESHIVKTANEIPTWIFTSCIDEEKAQEYKRYGVNIICTPKDKNGHVSLEYICRYLGENKIDSLLIEGGAKIHSAALQSGIVNKAQFYIAPKIIGGDGINSVEEMGIESMDDAVMLKNPKVRIFGEDVMIEYEVK